MTKKAVILCDGQVPPKDLLKAQIEEADFFIAADGGFYRASELGILPDLVIGDLDSVDVEVLKRQRVHFIHDIDQETNDLEKALNWLKKESFSDIHVLGATNKRMDHSLKNLSLLIRFKDCFNQLIIQDEYGYCFLCTKNLEMTFEVGQAISLIPLNGRVEGITTKGLMYSLDDEFLENGLRDGTSNQVTENQVRITFSSGELLIYLPSNKGSLV